MHDSSGGASRDSKGIYTPWAKRHGFSHGGMALIWIVAAFILFQLVASIIALVLILVQTHGAIDPANIGDLLLQNLDLVFIGNSIGQILFLALGTWFFCRLQVSKKERATFLRFSFHQNTMLMIGIVIILMIVVQPVIMFLSWLNAFLPVPDVLESMQLQQMDMIKSYLTGDGVVWVALFHIGLIPAVCEETLFRGYVLRSFQKSWGIKTAIILSGIIFGVFHLQLTNILPLATIGILLAYMTWASQSIVPAMVAHFVNNGASVLLGKFYPELAFGESASQSLPSVWLIILSGLVSAYLISLLLNNRVKILINPKKEAYAT